MPRRFLHLFFYLLYNPFAFTYDFVSSLVSFGRWNDWIRAALPFVEGARVLELGHGPGHLQAALHESNHRAIGLDESVQMGRLARRRLGSAAHLVRGRAQSLPFENGAFDCIVATFPTDYIFDARALSETRRCLSDGGRLIVLPAAWPHSGFLHWLYRVTGESPSQFTAALRKKFQEPFERAGFIAQARIIDVNAASLLFVTAIKNSNAAA